MIIACIVAVMVVTSALYIWRRMHAAGTLIPPKLESSHLVEDVLTLPEAKHLVAHWPYEKTLTFHVSRSNPDNSLCKLLDGIQRHYLPQYNACELWKVVCANEDGHRFHFDMNDEFKCPPCTSILYLTEGLPTVIINDNSRSAIYQYAVPGRLVTYPGNLFHGVPIIENKPAGRTTRHSIVMQWTRSDPSGSQESLLKAGLTATVGWESDWQAFDPSFSSKKEHWSHAGSTLSTGPFLAEVKRMRNSQWVPPPLLLRLAAEPDSFGTLTLSRKEAKHIDSLKSFYLSERKKTKMKANNQDQVESALFIN